MLPGFGEVENTSMRAQAGKMALMAMLCLGVLGRTQSPPKPHTEIAPEARIDINHATLEQLLKVPGMTPGWAGRIVRFRPYRTKQDLVEHGVVSGDVYERIKDYIIAHRDQRE